MRRPPRGLLRLGLVGEDRRGRAGRHLDVGEGGRADDREDPPVLLGHRAEGRRVRLSRLHGRTGRRGLGVLRRARADVPGRGIGHAVGAGLPRGPGEAEQRMLGRRRRPQEVGEAHAVHQRLRGLDVRLGHLLHQGGRRPGAVTAP
ncbi:hypothetical protein SBRY_120082 [Actinacidiphila bryophytorum]|uniref:Uncharacterized protein n=1 Tax=Actinacidiphila bryophytorum TaxID=1436133 RepID=A0A9W4GYW1_9ACTN|nr:hypothetical protein SBRY_120082 [Actinacidiphila bryophytorum]